eukprot:7998954-Alexandrium_andersonii.AAC.1
MDGGQKDIARKKLLAAREQLKGVKGMEEQLKVIDQKLADMSSGPVPGARRLYVESRKYLRKMRELKDWRTQELDSLKAKVVEFENSLKEDEQALVQAESMHREALKKYTAENLGDGDIPFTQ